MPRGQPRSIEVVESDGQRIVVAIYADGEVVRRPVDPNERPRRKPRKPIARAWSAKDKTRKKQIKITAPFAGLEEGHAMDAHKVEPIKRLLEKATGLGVPTREHALESVRAVKPLRMKFRDDGYIPNNPKLPLLYYRKVVRFDREHDPAATLEAVFNAHSWGEAWRNGIYDFVHYHSMIHEVLGVARGTAGLRLGGNKGKTFRVSAGDVVVIPAGVGHECLKASREFLVVGAYPPSGTYDECRGSFQERDKAIASIGRVAVPKKNPLFGARDPAW